MVVVDDGRAAFFTGRHFEPLRQMGVIFGGVVVVEDGRAAFFTGRQFEPDRHTAMLFGTFVVVEILPATGGSAPADPDAVIPTPKMAKTRTVAAIAGR